MSRRNRFLSVFTVLGTASLGLTCRSDRPLLTGIASSLSPSPTNQSGLLSCTPLRSTTVKQSVGPGGGTMVIGPHVFVVPPGALAAPVVITGKTTGDAGNAVYFKPAGLVFSIPASLTLSYANCNTLGSTASKEVAYTSDSLFIVYYVSSADAPSAKTVTGRIDHFSAFAVAW